MLASGKLSIITLSKTAMDACHKTAADLAMARSRFRTRTLNQTALQRYILFRGLESMSA
jgi:hypothetical protein